MSNKISKLLKVGENVYSAANGLPMKVTRMYSCGFETDILKVFIIQKNKT